MNLMENLRNSKDMLAKIKYFIFNSSQNSRDYIPNSTDNLDLKHLVGQRFAKMYCHLHFEDAISDEGTQSSNYQKDSPELFLN